ncbi:hypothetical protein HK097_002791, partial [Rhizophlyctis rosea]
MTLQTPATPSFSYTYLRTLPSIRNRTSLLLSHPTHLKNFTLNLSNLPKATSLVLSLISRDYASPFEIPMHSRWRHFEALPRGAPKDGSEKRIEKVVEG